MIEKGSEIKDRLMNGWELWHLYDREYVTMPGRWEMRKKGEANIPVSWEAIEKARRNLGWYEENTEYLLDREGPRGINDELYRYKQSNLFS